MDFDTGKKYFMQGIEIVKLNESVIKKISKDAKAFQYAIVFFAIGGIANALGLINIPGIIFNPIFAVVGSFIGVFVYHFLAKLFGGKGDFKEYYSVLGVGAVVLWVSAIPILGPLISGILGLWFVVVNIVILKSLYQLSTVKAIIVALIPVLVFFILAALLVGALLAALTGLSGAGISY